MWLLSGTARLVNSCWSLRAWSPAKLNTQWEKHCRNSEFLTWSMLTNVKQKLFTVPGQFWVFHSQKKTNKVCHLHTPKLDSKVASPKLKYGDVHWTPHLRFKNKSVIAEANLFCTRDWFWTGLAMKSHRAELNDRFRHRAAQGSVHQATQDLNANNWKLIRNRRVLNTVREICGSLHAMVRQWLIGMNHISATTLLSPKSLRRMDIDQVRRFCGDLTISAMSHLMPLATRLHAVSRFLFCPNSAHRYLTHLEARKAAKIGAQAVNLRFAKSLVNQACDSLS